MSRGLSEREAAAFAAIARRLGDPERRRFWRVGLAAASAFLLAAVVAEAAVLRWPGAAVVSFAMTFVVGLATGLALVTRLRFPNPE